MRVAVELLGASLQSKTCPVSAKAVLDPADFPVLNHCPSILVSCESRFQIISN
jgi:hypothetical protein